MIQRLRPKYSDEELSKVYDHKYDHKFWWDHRIRVKETIRIGSLIEGANSIADLSAGDAAIITGIKIKNKVIGDYVSGFPYCGKIEDTIKEIPNVDVFICSETLEHLDDPLQILKEIRSKTKWLLLSTPENNWDDENPEHYWAWDKEGVEKLLISAGFTPIYFESIPISYTHQIWICK